MSVTLKGIAHVYGEVLGSWNKHYTDEKYVTAYYKMPNPKEIKAPTSLKMISKVSTTTTTSSAGGPEPEPVVAPKPIHPTPVLPLQTRHHPVRGHMENVPYFNITSPTDDTDSGDEGVAKGKYSHYAELVRRASVPRTSDIPHSVEETKGTLKEELLRLANHPKYIDIEEQSELLSHIPKLNDRVSKYNLALEGVRVEDSGSDTDTQAQDEEEPEIMSPTEPLPKIKERYLSLATGEVILTENGKLVPRERTGSDPALADALTLQDRKSSYDKALEYSDFLDTGREVTRPHSPVPKIRERYLDVARGLTEPKPEDPEVEAHRNALMQQLRDADHQRKVAEEERYRKYKEERKYQDARRKEEIKESQQNVPVAQVKQEYLSRMAAPPLRLQDDETIVAKPSTPVNAIKSQLEAAANKAIEPRYHGIDPVTQEIISGDIDQASLPGFSVLKWRYTPVDEQKPAVVPKKTKPKLKPLDEFSWVAVDAVERQPKEPAWKECLDLLNLRVTEEMQTPSPQ